MSFYGFGNRVRTKGYTILLYGLIHILYYIRVSMLYYAMLYYANIVVTIMMTSAMTGDDIVTSFRVSKHWKKSPERLIVCIILRNGFRNKLKRKSEMKNRDRTVT
jgi:hypothetical protein